MPTTPDPYASIASPVASAPPQTDPYADIAAPAHSPDAWQPTQWGFKVKPAVTPDGKPTYQRQDGAMYFGPDQGNTGTAGWYDDKGNRLGGAPGQKAPETLQHLFSPSAIVGGIGDTLRYAGDVAQRPSQALGEGMARVTGDDDWRFKQAYGLGVSPQATAQDRAKLSAPAALVTDVVANPLTYVVPGAGSGTTLGTKIAHGAVTGNILATMDPDASPASVATATVMGGATPAVVQGASWLGSKALSALSGTKLGARLGIPGGAPTPTMQLNPKYAGQGASLEDQLATVEAGGDPTKLPPRQPSALDLSKQLDEAGITSHTVGDITGDPIVRAKEGALARNNPKMMALRLQENQQAAAAGDKVVSDLRSTLNTTGWQNVDDLKAAVAAGGKRAPQAQALLNAIENSGDDWKRIAQTSGNLNLMVNKLKADGLYDKAEAIAQLYGPVTPTKLTGSLDANISALSRDTAGDQSIVPYLQRIKAGLENGSQATDFASLRQMRSSLNDQLGSLTAPNSVVQNSNASRNALQNVTKALESDLDTYANSHSSGLRNAWKDASNYYRDNVVPYKDAEVGKLLADQDPLALGRLFSQKDPYSQQKMFDLLGPKGQAAVRAGLVGDALDAGEKTQRGVMGQSFGSANAAAKLEQLGRNGTMNVAFPGGEDKWAASGLAKILRMVDRSDNVGFTPPTGVTAQSVGAKVEGDTTMLGAAIKGIDWLNRDSLMNLYSNPKGKALLIWANNLPADSPSLKNIINNQIPKVLGVTAGRVGPSLASRPETPNDLGTPPR